jgi:hypothetical protein
VRNIISFEIAEIDGGALSVTPCIDGTPLTTLIAEFEKTRGYGDPAGAYAGLIPSYFDYGPLEHYFTGQAGNQGEAENGEDIYVLGCVCGEVECWPLITSVTRAEDGYKWAAFIQPHRQQRNYDGFGPFVFEKNQYEQAVGDMALKSEPTR